MNKIKNLIIILFLAISPIKLVGQENVCDCCSYSSLQYQQDYEEIFNPSIIKSKGIKEVMVYTEPKKSSDSTEIIKYREIKFKFNRNGLVISKTWYNRMGKPHSAYDLKRNKAGKIYQQIFNYIDSLEQISSFFGQEIIDFKYDSKNRLIKIKERGSKGQLLEDNKSMYTILKYDNKDRIISTERHRNYNNESSISKTTFTFSDNSFSSTYQSMRDGKLSLSGEKKYNKKWQETIDKTFNETLKSIAFEEHFEYDSNNRLLKYQSISGQGSASECPEGGNYTDNYKYNDNGLLIAIHHTFGQNICEMTFEYRK